MFQISNYLAFLGIRFDTHQCLCLRFKEKLTKVEIPWQEIGCSRYTGKVTDDKYRPVEVKANAKRSILAILGHSDSFVGVRK